MTIDYDTRVAQVCASLVREGHIFVGSADGMKLLFRHPNGNRLTVICDPPKIHLTRNGHTLKTYSLHCPPGT